MSKTYSRIYNHLFGVGFCLVLSGCATFQQTPASAPSAGTATSQEAQEPSPFPSSTQGGRATAQTPARQGDSPRALASLRLTEQARTLLDGGQTDDAISALERAVNLNPSNGRNYYYLAEAWLKKENPNQAREFNRLAAIYLRDEPDWMVRVKAQEEKIKKRL